MKLKQSLCLASGLFIFTAVNVMASPNTPPNSPNISSEHRQTTGAPHADGISNSFLQLDANQDGALTNEEYSVARLPKKFSDLDANGDEKLTEQELRDGFTLR